MTNNSERFPHRYTYEKLEPDSTLDGKLPNISEYLTLNFNTEPSELPFIEGYRFVGEVMTLTPKDTNPEWKSLESKAAFTATARSKVETCANYPCTNQDCSFHSGSPYFYWSKQLDSWHDCGHYHHRPTYQTTNYIKFYNTDCTRTYLEYCNNPYCASHTMSVGYHWDAMLNSWRWFISVGPENPTQPIADA